MAANNDHIVRAAVLPHIVELEGEASISLDALHDAHGCEAGTQRGYERGRLDALLELRRSLGLPAPDQGSVASH